MRKWIDIIVEGADPYVYHGSMMSNLPAIRREGLVPQEPGPEGWPEYDGEDEPEAHEARVFAFEDAHSALEYASNFPDPLVLRMPISGIDWETGWTDYRYLYTTASIPPQQLEMKVDDAWVPILTITEQVAENPAGPQTVQDVANYLKTINDDILPDHYMEVDYREATDQQCWDMIKRVYHSGSCEEFALAMHDIYGWNIIQIRDAANPGMHHIVCEMPDERLVDVTGIVSREELKRRYRMRKPVETPYQGGFFQADDYDDPWGAIAVAKWVVDHLGYEPFW